MVPGFSSFWGKIFDLSNIFGDLTYLVDIWSSGEIFGDPTYLGDIWFFGDIFGDPTYLVDIWSGDDLLLVAQSVVAEKLPLPESGFPLCPRRPVCVPAGQYVSPSGANNRLD